MEREGRSTEGEHLLNDTLHATSHLNMTQWSSGFWGNTRRATHQMGHSECSVSLAKVAYHWRGAGTHYTQVGRPSLFPHEASMFTNFSHHNFQLNLVVYQLL
ncbi:hypothetical protein AALO_G00296040 [Alosa alosa]|uniref:Uncharacterized protein n=1 Tax=Alosa alosa TaxID=278164 RepID=A0AAV6FD93_9TELE|nr:hypothetical protein AALO_G00296040 [Alosa alosa]